MGKVNALWMDEMEARADALLAAGVDPADAWDRLTAARDMGSRVAPETDQSNGPSTPILRERP